MVGGESESAIVYADVACASPVGAGGAGGAGGVVGVCRRDI